METSLLTTEQLPNNTGYTWTLTSRLGQMLRMSEELFGPRDYSYTILGIEFMKCGPQIWYPGNCQHISIQLSFSAAKDMSQACYQLAHETIHLLAPTGCRNATNLEEGIACYFAQHYMKKVCNEPNWKPAPHEYEYTQALEAVKCLLEKDLYGIRELRTIQPSFQNMTPEDIIKVFPKLKPEKISFLLEKFNET